MKIRAEPLTPESFAPFGTVIWADPRQAVEVNVGYATRFTELARVEVEGGGAQISIFRGRPRPLSLTLMERHPHGTQAFMPLGRARWLVAVADSPTRPRAFLCEGWQGVQYGRGVWHHPLLVLGGEQDFLVVDRVEPESNVEEIALPEAVEIAV